MELAGRADQDQDLTPQPEASAQTPNGASSQNPAEDPADHTAETPAETEHTAEASQSSDQPAASHASTKGALSHCTWTPTKLVCMS